MKITKSQRKEQEHRASFLPPLHETGNQLQMKIGKLKNVWKLKNLHLNKRWVNEEIKREVGGGANETSRNKNITHQNLSDATNQI